jgi:diguanylate cyclase (GGDEF)-like protein/PAS domain S-box-containing protein
MAKTIAGLRAGARPRDLIGRVERLLLALALLNAAGAMVAVVVSHPDPPILALVGLAAPPALAAAWIWAYGRQRFDLPVEVITIAGACVVAMAVERRWNGEVVALLSAAVLYSATYGPLRRVLGRSALLAAIVVGRGLSDPEVLTTNVVFAIGFLVLAALVNGMVVWITHYESTAGQSTERFEALIEASSDVISIVSPEGKIRFQSPSIRQVFGYEPADRLGGNVAEAVHPDDAERFAADFARIVGELDRTLVCEYRIRHADGSWRHIETRLTNLMDVPAIGGIVLNSRDVTERHALEAELRHQAFHDSLTGLANRALFANRIEHALAHAMRDGSTIAVLYCTMDGFDRLNDSLGYHSADTALTMVADRLRSCVRGPDTVARLGGNDFGVLLDRLTIPADATVAMERLLKVLREPLALPAASVEFQPQIGIAIAVGGNDTADDLLRKSALAVRNARRSEGGYALFDPEMHADAIRRLEVESQLREAIEQSQFMLYYQPTIDLQTGRVTGVEALVRWQHPRRGLVAPMEFIPLAEESGLIIPIGEWTIHEACRQIRAWQQEIPTDEPIAIGVNLSARQLRHPNLVRDVTGALDETGLLPSHLILEITESTLMTDTAATLNRLFQLKSLGVRLAVDDFGTGYSSLAYLRRFPVDILKIDKTFIDGVATEPTASALVDAMIRIGKTLHLETVAEGVERAEQADQLRTLHCDIGQGYLFSRPVAQDSIPPLLRERASPTHASAA